MIRRLLFIIGGLNCGGTENYLLRLCRFIRQSDDFCNIDISILYNGKYRQLVSPFQALGVRLFPVQGNPARNVTAVSRILAEESFDAVCTFTVPAFFALYLAGHYGIPVRAAFLRVRYRTGTLHQKTLPFPLNILFDRAVIAAERFFLPKIANRIFSNSQTALDEILRKNDKRQTFKTAVIRNGIPFPDDDELQDEISLRKELGIAEGMKLVGHVAAFRPQKNHVLAVRIAEKICAARQDVCFVFFGEGTTRGIPLLRGNRFADRILAFEPRSDIFSVLRLLDAFILPSFSEGQSNALMEAMGMGVPFVVSDCPENLEILPDGFEEYAVSVNEQDEFARKIEEILDSGWTEQQRETCRRFARAVCHPEQNFRQFLEKWLADTK